MTHINIDHLEIRLKGIPPDVARSTVAGLGSELAMGLMKQMENNPGKNSSIFKTLDAGSLKINAPADQNILRRAIAEHVAAAVARSSNRFEKPKG